MTSSADQHEIRNQLFEAILKLQTLEECRAFFDDLATPNELSALADRWLAAQCLEIGMPYREIYEQTGVSTATVTRVARALTAGAGGYRLVLGRMAARKSKLIDKGRNKSSQKPKRVKRIAPRGASS